MIQVIEGWIANLSNGETITETMPVPGERSSWQKLLDRIASEPELHITALRMQHGNIVVSCDYHRKSLGYVMAYEACKSVYSGAGVHSQGIGTIVNDLVFMTWMDQYGNVRQEIRPLSEMKVHSTLRDVHGCEQGNTQ